MTSTNATSSDHDLFPAGWEKSPTPNGGLSRDDEAIWFTRLYVARRFAKQSPDSVWADRERLIRDFICRCNIGLALAAVKRYARNKRVYLHDDFKSAALAALLNAIDHFDAHTGNKLSTYAMTCIYRVLSRIHYREKTHPVSRASEKIDRLYADPKSGLDREREENTEALRAAMKSAPLTDVERQVIQCRFFDGLTLDETGRKVGLSKERIRHIQEEGLFCLRSTMEGKSSEESRRIFKKLPTKHSRMRVGRRKKEQQ